MNRKDVGFWAGGGTEGEPADEIQLRLLVYVLDYEDGKLLSELEAETTTQTYSLLYAC
jgi:hypothetical protein